MKNNPKDSDGKVRPFDTDEQFYNWTHANCDSCQSGFDHKRKYRCKWERLLDESHVTDRMIAKETAQAIGFPDIEDVHIWKCPKWRRR